MILPGQPKPETILEEDRFIHLKGNKKYKVWSKKLSSKQVPHNYYWIVRPKQNLHMYNVYANVGLHGFGRHFLISHHHFLFFRLSPFGTLEIENEERVRAME